MKSFLLLISACSNLSQWSFGSSGGGIKSEFFLKNVFHLCLTATSAQFKFHIFTKSFLDVTHPQISVFLLFPMFPLCSVLLPLWLSFCIILHLLSAWIECVLLGDRNKTVFFFFFLSSSGIQHNVWHIFIDKSLHIFIKPINCFISVTWEQWTLLTTYSVLGTLLNAL